MQREELYYFLRARESTVRACDIRGPKHASPETYGAGGARPAGERPWVGVRRDFGLDPMGAAAPQHRAFGRAKAPAAPTNLRDISPSSSGRQLWLSLEGAQFGCHSLSSLSSKVLAPPESELCVSARSLAHHRLQPSSRADLVLCLPRSATDDFWMRKAALLLSVLATASGRAEGGLGSRVHRGHVRRELVQHADGNDLAALWDCDGRGPCTHRRALKQVVQTQTAEPEELYVQGTPVENPQPGWQPWPYHSWGPWQPSEVCHCDDPCTVSPRNTPLLTHFLICIFPSPPSAGGRWSIDR